MTSFVIYRLYLLSFQKKSVEGGKQGASLKKQKKDKVGVATGKSSRTEGSTVTTAPRVKPELALPAMYSSDCPLILLTKRKKEDALLFFLSLLHSPSLTWKRHSFGGRNFISNTVMIC